MINVAVLGFGVVGGGVVKLITDGAERLAAAVKDDIRVKYILDIRQFPDSPYKDLIVNDFSVIENDPSVQIVVETIGGVRAAYEFTKRALLAGKNVVTSNKELVAEKGAELLEIAAERNLNYLFEASVGGGIPIIRPLSQCLLANRIESICGILNGTSNYILTAMLSEGKKLEQALKEAQANGYAEANPTADIEGPDTCRKICILASLCCGKRIAPEDVPTVGITSIELGDLVTADRAGYTIKLLGVARMHENGEMCVFVEPHLIKKDAPLGGVNGVFNAIYLHGDAVGDVMFYGRGAGDMPTASAVVADVIDVSRHFKARKYIGWKDEGTGISQGPDKEVSRFYVRAAALPAQIRAEQKLYCNCGEAAVTQPCTRAEVVEMFGDMPVQIIRVLD